MILQALAKYYERMVQDGIQDLEPIGYKRATIPFIINLKKDGRIAGIDDTRTSDGRRRLSRLFIVPKVFDGSRTSDIESNLLWDKASYVFGVSAKEGKNERLQKQKDKFLSTILDYFPDEVSDDGVIAVVNFLKYHAESIQEFKEWEEIKSKDQNLAFKLEGENMLVCNREAVSEAISRKNKSLNADKGLCLISGNIDSLAELENPIKGLRGSGKAESHLVSFNDFAYWSYGKTYGANAPISKTASAAYVIAINYMQRDNSRQWIKVGNATTVFWAGKKHKIEDWFTDIFGEPATGESDQDNAAIRALFDSMKTGVPPLEWNLNQFYVLGLSPNAARIAIRFWYEGTVAEVAINILQHFKDISIEHAPHYPEYLSLSRLLKSTALLEKTDNIQPNLAGDFMKAILAGTPYPNTLLSSAMRRIKAEQSRRDRNGKSIPNVTYERASLIKAVLFRNARYYNHNEKEVGMALDTNNINPGYLLGRLFAVLEKVQIESAGGEGKINATIRDRFYGSASSTPVAVFAHLMKLKNHHLAKLENYKNFYEKLIGEITDKISPDNAYPAHLSLDDQGRFAVGYYHQRQDFFKKKDNS